MLCNPPFKDIELVVRWIVGPRYVNGFSTRQPNAIAARRQALHALVFSNHPNQGLIGGKQRLAGWRLPDGGTGHDAAAVTLYIPKTMKMYAMHSDGRGMKHRFDLRVDLRIDIRDERTGLDGP